MKPPSSAPAVVEQTYALWLWLDAHAVHLPAHARASLGARALDAALDLLAALLDAAYTPRADVAHAAALRTAARHANLLRYLLRGMHDRHHLSHDQHGHVAAQLDVIARAVGAWRKARP